MIMPKPVCLNREDQAPAPPPAGESERLYSFHRLLTEVKNQEPVVALADRLWEPGSSSSEWQKCGALWVTRCPLPNHVCEWSLSFGVWTERNCWHCSECQIGGDILDLYALAKGYTNREGALLDLTTDLLEDPSCHISDEALWRLSALFDQFVSALVDHERG